MIEALSGVITSIIIIILTRALSAFFSTRLIATTILVAIAFIYVGFSLQTNLISSIVLETSVALFFYFLALTGCMKNSLLIAYGIMLHGVWDVLHHKGLVATSIPGYWPSFCLVVDVITGLYIFLVYKAHKNTSQ
jgi:hypothetical protein